MKFPTKIRNQNNAIFCPIVLPFYLDQWGNLSVLHIFFFFFLFAMHPLGGNLSYKSWRKKGKERAKEGRKGRKEERKRGGRKKEGWKEEKEKERKNEWMQDIIYMLFWTKLSQHNESIRYLCLQFHSDSCGKRLMYWWCCPEFIYFS